MVDGSIESSTINTENIYLYSSIITIYIVNVLLNMGYQEYKLGQRLYIFFPRVPQTYDTLEMKRNSDLHVPTYQKGKDHTASSRYE